MILAGGLTPTSSCIFQNDSRGKEVLRSLFGYKRVQINSIYTCSIKTSANKNAIGVFAIQTFYVLWMNFHSPIAISQIANLIADLLSSPNDIITISHSKIHRSLSKITIHVCMVKWYLLSDESLVLFVFCLGYSTENQRVAG